MTDHLEEAKTALSELEPDVFSNPPIGPEMAQAHALIAIAEELRRHNDREDGLRDFYDAVYGGEIVSKPE